MKKSVAILLCGVVFTSLISFATDRVLLGRFVDESGLKLEIKPAGARLGDEPFPLDEETIVAAHGESGSGSGFWDSVKNAECKAEIHLAKRAANGQLVLLRLFKRKASLSGGWFCKTSMRVSAFEEIYAFEQIVLMPTELGYRARKLSVWDSPERPKVRQAELEDPLLLEKNSALKAYVDAEANAGLPKASLSKLVFSPDAAPALPPSTRVRPARE